MSDCIFCKIANGEIPSTSIYEDDKVKVIFDISPATLGHALVLPKSHAANVFEIDDELLAHAHIVAKKVATALKETTGCKGVNILQNNGEVAGQSVFHLHIHVIPRYDDDDAHIKWTPGTQDTEKLAEIAEKVKAVL